MSTLSDVQALYGNVRGTWAKSQADVIAHLVLAAVVFWICGATMSSVPLVAGFAWLVTMIAGPRIVAALFILGHRLGKTLQESPYCACISVTLPLSIKHTDDRRVQARARAVLRVRDRAADSVGSCIPDWAVPQPIADQIKAVPVLAGTDLVKVLGEGGGHFHPAVRVPSRWTRTGTSSNPTANKLLQCCLNNIQPFSRMAGQVD